MEYEYKLVQALTAEGLEMDVNSKLLDGWQCYGYPFVYNDNGYYQKGQVQRYCQAMVRQRKTNDLTHN